MCKPRRRVAWTHVDVLKVVERESASVRNGPATSRMQMQTTAGTRSSILDYSQTLIDERKKVYLGRWCVHASWWLCTSDDHGRHSFKTSCSCPINAASPARPRSSKQACKLVSCTTFRTGEASAGDSLLVGRRFGLEGFTRSLGVAAVVSERGLISCHFSTEPGYIKID